MTDYRELGITEVKNRIIRDKDVLGVNSIWRNSNSPIDKLELNAIYIIEGKDIITEHASRSFLGYPARRMLELEIEMIAKNDRDGKAIKTLYQLTRKAILCDLVDDVYVPNPVVAENTIIRELRTYGPNLYQVPELIGIKMILSLLYMDEFNLN